MPVPTSWDDISTNPVQNSPQGNEPLGNQADDYIRQAFAFSKQLHDGWLAANGAVKMAANLDANQHSINNLAAPAAAGDAVPKSYADGLISGNFPRGAIILWFGQLAQKPAGWQLCDGTNGAPDLRDRVAMGAGASLAVGAYGGNNSPVITAAQMPVHAHSVSDPGHAHGVYDPGHAHGVNDPGHAHSQINISGSGIGGNYFGNGTNNFSGGGSGMFGWGGTPFGTNLAGSGIGINGSGTGIGIYGSGTGISIGNAGGNAAFDNRPAFCALYYLMKS